MEKMVCDRCGRIYEKYGEVFGRNEVRTVGVQVDLCKKCNEDFRSFLKTNTMMVIQEEKALKGWRLLITSFLVTAMIYGIIGEAWEGVEVVVHGFSQKSMADSAVCWILSCSLGRWILFG